VVYKEWLEVAKRKLYDCLDGKLPLAEFEQWLADNTRGVKKR